MPNKKAMVVLATGAEEMELVIAVDVLRRAGVAVTIAGLNMVGPIQCSRDVLISSDCGFEDAMEKGPFDAVVLPGGLVGSKNLCTSSMLGECLKAQELGGRIIAAICAAPLALKAHGVCFGKRLTSYPSVRDDLLEGGHYTYCEDNVVCDGLLLTSRGPGTAFEFALALVEKLEGQEVSDTVASALLLK